MSNLLKQHGEKFPVPVTMYRIGFKTCQILSMIENLSCRITGTPPPARRPSRDPQRCAVARHLKMALYWLDLYINHRRPVKAPPLHCPLPNHRLMRGASRHRWKTSRHKIIWVLRRKQCDTAHGEALRRTEIFS